MTIIEWVGEDDITTYDFGFKNCEKSDFYQYDHADVLNMLYSDYCEIFTDTTYYLKMAKMYLTDPDYPGKADERAYHSAIKRIEYFKNK